MEGVDLNTEVHHDNPIRWLQVSSVPLKYTSYFLVVPDIIDEKHATRNEIGSTHPKIKYDLIWSNDWECGNKDKNILGLNKKSKRLMTEKHDTWNMMISWLV